MHLGAESGAFFMRCIIFFGDALSIFGPSALFVLGDGHFFHAH